MKEYFTEPSKMKKLSIIVLIVGLLIGITILIITGICENNDKNRQSKGLFNKIVDKVDNYLDDQLDDYESDLREEASNFLKKTSDIPKTVFRKVKYTPYYFIGGFINFITIGSSVTLFILAKVNENKLKQAN